MYLTLVRPRKVWTLNSEEDTGLLKLFTLLTLMSGHMTHVIKNYPGIIQHIENCHATHKRKLLALLKIMAESYDF